MNDNELKSLFKAMKHGVPSELEMARWKKVVRKAIQSQTPAEWARLAVACLIGVLIGATAFRGKTIETENNDAGATIERVYINIQ